MKLSYIVPVYKVEKYLEECVESVLDQSMDDYELILVDDGSPDNCPAMCDAYAEKYPEKIRVVHKQNGGLASARNAGLRVAKGDYIFFLDSDDIIHPRLLEIQVNALIENNASVAGVKLRNVSAQGWSRVYDMIEKSDTTACVTCQDTVKTLHEIFFNSAPLGCIGGTMMKRNLIGDTRFKTDLFIGEDFYFIYENLIKNVLTVFINKKWYYVRIHNTNVSWQYDFDGFWTSFLRRKLVWESEERFGRTQNANEQKLEAFSCYTNCILKNSPHSAQIKKMQKEIKKYNKVIVPALSTKNKMRYWLAVYMPSVYLLLLRITKKG